MSVVNNQRLYQGGSILHLAKYDASNVLGAWRDFGTITVVPPNVAPTTISAKDSRSGKLITIEQRVTEFVEQFTVQTLNLSLENQIYLFGADSVASFTQSGVAVTNAEHTAYLDSIVPILNSSGESVYNIASIQAVTDVGGGTVYVADTDYEYDATTLKLGYIKIPAGSSIPDGDPIEIDYTPTAIAASDRVMNPWTAGVMKVRAEVLWTQENYADVIARDMIDCNVAAAGAPNFSDTDYSNMSLQFTVLGDPTNSTRPAGRVIHPIGSVAPRVG